MFRKCPILLITEALSFMEDYSTPGSVQAVYFPTGPQAPHPAPSNSTFLRLLYHFILDHCMTPNNTSSNYPRPCTSLSCVCIQMGPPASEQWEMSLAWEGKLAEGSGFRFQGDSALRHLLLGLGCLSCAGTRGSIWVHRKNWPNPTTVETICLNMRLLLPLEVVR